MIIEITDKQVKDLIDVFNDELSYKIFESDCANEYKLNIEVFIMLLDKLGEKEKANEYTNAFKEFMENM